MTVTGSEYAHVQPDVSVIMPAWKAADYIEASIDSVLASEGVSLELIIVDDASPDATFGVLEQRAATDGRIRVDRLESNGGPSAARNRALELARGRYVAVVDSDDTLARARLRKLVAIADAEGADIVVDNMVEVDAEGGRLGRAPFLKGDAFSAPRDISLGDYVKYNQPLKSGDCLGYLKPLIRRETLGRLCVRYDETLRNSEDYYLVATLLARGARMTYTSYAGYFYQRAAGSTSHRLKPEHTQAWLDAELAFHEAYLNTLDQRVVRQLERRERGLRDADQFVRAVEAIKQRRLGDLTLLLREDLHATRSTLGWFTKIAWQRLTSLGGGMGKAEAPSR